MTGSFISVEGIDGAGKTTVCEAIDAEFDNVLVTQSPTDEWTGRMVREALTGDHDLPPLVVLYLFMADMAYHTEEIIAPALLAGKNVVSDRYLDSTVAYQSRDIDDRFMSVPEVVSWIEEVSKPWYIEPDRTIYVDVSPETAVRRMGGEDIFENEEKQRETRAAYKERAETHAGRFCPISGEKPVGDMCEEAISAVENLIDQRNVAAGGD